MTSASLPDGVDAATWLADDVLLLVGGLGHRPSAKLVLSLGTAKQRVLGDAAWMELPWPDDVVGEDRHRYLLVVRIPTAEQHRATLVVGAGRGSSKFAVDELRQGALGLKTVLRRWLAPLDADTRAQVIRFLAEGEHRRSSTPVTLSRRLHLVREGLREVLPARWPSAEHALGLHVDALSAADERTFWVKGWIHEGEAAAVRLTAVAPDGQRAELLDDVVRYPRPDVGRFYAPAGGRDASSGFVCCVELPNPCPLWDGWVFELEDAEGTTFEVRAHAAISDDARVEREILEDLAHQLPGEENLFRDHALRALTALRRRHQDVPTIRRVLEVGDPPDAPRTSVIVPLYKRIDLVETQLATLADDADFQQTDLIYVLDSPEQERELLGLCGDLHELYRVPFRVAILEQHHGFAGANNAGATLARGRLLLLLNSDVLPALPGWLTMMARFYEATAGIGALGPKLLFDDDSLQHAGIYFHRAPASHVWENAHYFKGLHRSVPGANVTRTVPAVTGACLMIARSLYERFDGLRGIYVQGDYEDTDLCLRLLEAGFENWYLAECELYHLEGQSYDLAARLRNGRYNSWLHTHLWNDAITDVMA